MTDQERLKKLLESESLLKQTTRGYTPSGVYWRRAMPMLWEVRLDMAGTPDGDQLAEAHGFLKLTEKGWDPRAPNWREAMERIDWVEAGLAKPPIPFLGPTEPGGKNLLLQALSHNSDGLFKHTGSQYPAFDFGWTAGKRVLAPEPLIVTKQSSAQGADAFYATGDSGLKYWLGHIVAAPATGTRFNRGDTIGKIAAIPGADHAHLGIDARPLIDKDFLWGRKGNGPDYTWGSPTVGQQLTKELAL